MTLEELNTEYVNIAKLSNHELGRRLTMGFSHEFSNSFNTFNNIRVAIDYLFIEGYPEKFITKKKLTKKDINQIPKLTKAIPNYWAAVAHLFISRMDNDEVTRTMIKENNLPFVSYSVKIVKDPYVGDLTRIEENHKLNNYIKIIKHYEMILKHHKTEEEYMTGCKTLIDSFKNKSHDFVYAGNVRNINK